MVGMPVVMRPVLILVMKVTRVRYVMMLYALPFLTQPTCSWFDPMDMVDTADMARGGPGAVKPLVDWPLAVYDLANTSDPDRGCWADCFSTPGPGRRAPMVPYVCWVWPFSELRMAPSDSEVLDRLLGA